MGSSWPRRFCCDEELAFIGYDGRDPSRYFIYRHETVRGLLSEAGYREIYSGGIRAWRVVAYRPT